MNTIPAKRARRRLHLGLIAGLLLLTVSTPQPSISNPQLGEKLRERIRARFQAQQAASGTADQSLVSWGTIAVSNSSGAPLADRSYALLVPPAVTKAGQRVPLVIVLHGGGGNASISMKATGFNEKAMKEGFIVVYPQGSSRFKDIMLTWNAVHCCGFAMENKIDDISFISQLIDKLCREQLVDSKRIYVTGWSNGGMMTHRLGIALSGKIAAIAPVVSTLFGDEKQPQRPVPAIIFNGLLDRAVQPKGGSHGGRFADSWDNVPPLKIESQASFWAKANGCTSPAQKFENDKYIFLRYNCPSGKNVEMYMVKDNGHAWPGGQSGSPKGDTPSQAINATNLMWDFFKKQSLP